MEKTLENILKLSEYLHKLPSKSDLWDAYIGFSQQFCFKNYWNEEIQSNEVVAWAWYTDFKKSMGKVAINKIYKHMLNS